MLARLSAIIMDALTLLDFYIALFLYVADILSVRDSAPTMHPNRRINTNLHLRPVSVNGRKRVSDLAHL